MDTQTGYLLVVEYPRHPEFVLEATLRWSYRVVTARNGKEGAGEHSKERPDLIIADI
jgi:DNA-binding response OmpR family regulator